MMIKAEDIRCRYEDTYEGQYSLLVTGKTKFCTISYVDFIDTQQKHSLHRDFVLEYNAH